MSNGQTRAIDTIREYERSGEKIPTRLKNELIWGAILDLYDRIESKKVATWFVDRILPAVLTGAALWGLFNLLPAVVAHVGAP